MTNQDDEFFSAPPAPGVTQQEPTLYDFTVDLADPFSLQQTRTRPNWKTIGLISGGVALAVGLAFLIVMLVSPNLLRSAPVRTAIRYYDLLNEEKYREAYELLEPGTKSPLQFETEIRNMIGTFVTWDIPYQWDFVEMKYQSTEMDADKVMVQVDGYLRIMDTQTERHLDLPYSDLLLLIQRNHQWYIRP